MRSWLVGSTVSGTPQVGVKLTASAGTWSPAGGTYSYQWYAGGTAVSGARYRTFTPRAEHLGKRLQVKVTATKTGAKTGTAMSASTVATAPGPERFRQRSSDARKAAT